MRLTLTDVPSGRDETINLRTSRKQKALIDQAAAALGRSRSDFMLDAACREAETILLDRRHFGLDAEAFAAFMEQLDRPTEDNPKLRRLMETRPPWDE